MSFKGVITLIGEIKICGKWKGENIPLPFVMSDKLLVDRLKAERPSIIESN